MVPFVRSDSQTTATGGTIGRRVGAGGGAPSSSARASVAADGANDDATTSMHRPEKLPGRRGTARLSFAVAALTILLALVLIDLVAAAAAEGDDAADGASSSSGVGVGSGVAARLRGMRSLLESRPGMFLNMTIRVGVATVIMINIDAFLKVVVTPLLAASVVGAVAAPFTFVVGQALQPLVYSICFFGFDDRFAMASLEATGAKDRLASLNPTGEWHKVGTFERYWTRWCIKSLAGIVLGFAGLAASVPVVGPALTASFAGWAVAWDVVYLPLSGMGRAGVIRQGASVLHHFWEYHWFGFWAVLMEEIPLVGPACHVYNVYSAAFFLERVYLKDGAGAAAAATAMFGGLSGGGGEL